jgi:glycosyltransferase involved in cell wall biosynthesis
LHVGGFGPNKNLLVLVEAFAALRRDPRFEGVALVLVGRREDDAPYDESQALDRLIEDRGLAQRVIFTGRQSDQALRDLYQGAEALVVASLEEGFGLPGLEAVACGTPVVATVQSPLPDLLDGAVLPVDPHSPAGLHHAFATLLGNAPERERLRRGAVPLGPTLRWERSAREALRIFRDVATGHRAP